VILDLGGIVLPRGIAFLQPGWWLLHLLAILFVYLYGYRKGRGDEKRARRLREIEGRRANTPPAG
jgi:hypothetical protein